MAGVHGDEPTGVRVVRATLCRLLEMPADTLGEVRVVVMPLANPDGCAAGTRTNANGIGVNRSFPTADFGTGEKST